MPLYVVEISIAIMCHMPISNRCQIENPAEFGVKRGYWKIALMPDEIGNDKPSGVDIILELTAESIEEAEDAALNAGKSLSLYFSAFTGQPSTSPHLRRLTEVGPARGIVEQRRYYYENDREALTTMEMTPWKFSSFLRRVTQKSPRTRQWLEMAIRWYNIGLGSGDSLDVYLAYWIGLEALYEPMAELYHLKSKAESCPICQKVPRIIRNVRNPEGLLAINHLIERVAPELLKKKSILDLSNLRHFVAHPDKSVREDKSLDEVRKVIEPLIQDIQLCLAVGILSLVNPPKEDPGTVTLWATPRVEPHPYSMVQVNSDMELKCYDPWTGNWIDVEHSEKKVSSRIDESGLYLAQMESEIPITVESRGPKPNIEREYVVFKRGMSISDRGDPPVHRGWRPISISSAWKRMKEKES